ncbi:MAG: two-component regulator propeller domain-containing protein [Vicinamibacterales bacterium]
MTWLLAAALLLGAPPSPALPSAPPPAYSLDTWEVDDGLPQNSVISIIQSRDGYLWLGTWAGLVRFDGVRFTPVATGLTNTHILALAEAADGAIWIGTGGGGVARWHDGALTTFTKADGLAHDEVRSLLFDGAGRLWVGTLDGVSVIAEGVISSPPIVGGRLPAPVVIALARGRGDQVLLATIGGLCVATGLQVTCPEPDASHPVGLTSVAVDGRGQVLVAGTPWGVARWTGTAYAPIETCGAAPCHWSTDIITLGTLADGSVLVGDRGRAAILGVDGRVREIGALPDSTVWALYEDPEGSLWLGTDGRGLTRLRPTRVRSYGAADGLPGPVTTSIVQDGDGRIWAGTRCGPVVRLGASGRFEPAPAAIATPCAVPVLSGRDGTLWVGDDSRGVVAWRDGRVTRFDMGTGLASNRTRVLYEDRAGAIWIATEADVLQRVVDGRLEAFAPGEAGPGSSISAFAEDEDGRLFVGSNATGLFVRDGPRFTRVTDPDGGFTSRLVSALLRDSRGDLWIGTANQGLFRMREGRFEHFGVAQGLPDPVVALILEDDDGNLWVSTSHGISRLLHERIEAVASGAAASTEPIVLGKADGLRSIEGSGGGFDPSGLKDRDGRLWFSTLGGIVVVDPRHIALNTVPPPVVVENATLDEVRTVRAGAGGIVVPADTRGIEIAYTAFSLLAPNRVRFRYRLDGFDPAWHDAGTRRSVFYTNLPPGTFRFEVLAANNDGVWSPAPATVSLVVLPYWWQRRPVQLAGLVLLLVATGTGARAVALRRARARVAELERARALDDERSRIARDLHDDIGARLTHLALLADDSATPTVRRVLSAAARETARTLDELVWAVNASNDTAEGFATYAMRFAETHGRAAGLRVRFDAPASLAGHELKADTRRHLFLAFKEAVNNAVKHAGAGELRVRVAVEDGVLAVNVADDGRGLPPGGGDPTGNGLTNMRARMEAVGGTLELARPAAGGTTVRFRVRVP